VVTNFRYFNLRSFSTGCRDHIHDVYFITGLIYMTKQCVSQSSRPNFLWLLFVTLCTKAFLTVITKFSETKPRVRNRELLKAEKSSFSMKVWKRCFRITSEPRSVHQPQSYYRPLLHLSAPGYPPANDAGLIRV